MYEWLIEIEEPQSEVTLENGELHIERINPTTPLTEMSEICQLFAAFDVLLHTDSFTSLPAESDKALKTIMSEIAPHYEEVQQIFINGKRKEINVRFLKNTSKEIIKQLLSDGISPIIPDLYRSSNSKLPTSPRKLTYYEVNKAKIEPLFLKETEKTKEFITLFFIDRGSIALRPTGWFLTAELKESITIRMFSTFAEKVVLVVDDMDGSVVGLDIYG